MKNILIIGRGGREHALAKSFSKTCRVFVAPGNSGMKDDCVIVNIDENNFKDLITFAKENNIDLTFVGPEVPLVNGIVDKFTKEGLVIFGPNKKAARIEGSKDFAKELMKKYNIPTADYKTFTNLEEAVDYIKDKKAPYVLKADGLAAGKGVVISQTLEEAKLTLESMLGDNNPKNKVVIEDFLEGYEFSFMAFVNGDKVYPLQLARDYKKALNKDMGQNTGGMGAFSPVPQISESSIGVAISEIIQKTANAMVAENIPFIGVLYAGLIETSTGPKVIEFNARFGDPETEVLLPRLNSNIYDFTMAVLNKEDFVLEWSEKFCLGVVLASGGYPNKYETNFPIQIKSNALIYYSGVCGDSPLKTAGGRVLVVTSFGDNLEEAKKSAYEEVEKISFENMHYRNDIGS